MGTYPSFYNSLTRQYFSDWNYQELEEIGLKIIKTSSVEPNLKDLLLQGAISLHLKARELARTFFENQRTCPQVSAGSFIRLLTTQEGIHKQLQTRLTQNHNLYSQGVSSLQFTEDQIIEMSNKIESIFPMIEEATKEVKDRGRTLEVVNVKVDAMRKSVQSKEKLATDLDVQAKAIQKECDEAVGSALPALYESIERIASLKPSDATAAGASKAPPAALKMVMAAVCILMDVKPPKSKGSKATPKIQEFWLPSKKLLMDPGFLTQIQELDPDNVSDHAIDRVSTDFIKSNDFEPSQMTKLSPFAEILCRWIHALVRYRTVSKVSEKFTTICVEFIPISIAKCRK